MVAINRPNRDALTKAIDIFRDVMRPFLIRSLRREHGPNVEEAIRQSLQYEQQIIDFERNLQQGGDLASAVDVNHFPRLVEHHWRDVFSAPFSGDQTIVRKLWVIKGARNEVSHPPTRDLDANYTEDCLSHIAYVLGKVNSLEGKRTVEGIRSALTDLSVPGNDVRSNGIPFQAQSENRAFSRGVEKTEKASTRHRARAQARARQEARTKKEAKAGKGEDAKKIVIFAALGAALGLISYLRRKARPGEYHEQ